MYSQYFSNFQDSFLKNKNITVTGINNQNYINIVKNDTIYKFHYNNLYTIKNYAKKIKDYNVE